MNSDAAPGVDRPLAGLRVVVTRTSAQAASLRAALEVLGAAVIVAPAIHIVPCATPELDTWLLGNRSADWLVFTSSNAVDAFFARLESVRLQAGDLAVTSVAAIGAATARRVERAGLHVELIAPVAVAESLADALVARGMAGARVVLPLARLARDVLAQRLRDAGADVQVFAVYDTVSGIDPAQHASVAAADIITVSSPSAVDGLTQADIQWRRSPQLVCIGPVTAARAYERGWERISVAEDASVAGLVAAVCPAARERAYNTEECIALSASVDGQTALGIGVGEEA